MNFLSKIFGSSNSRKIKKLQRKVVKINQLEKAYSDLTDKDLANLTIDLMRRHSDELKALMTCCQRPLLP